tara:strand:+ start:398 stop:1225 length:828 start_codon:yes stop_codon:yes gene_type:complete
MRKKKLKINETTIITGGCRGLGLACAEFLLSKNLHLSIIDLNSKVSSVYNETERLNNLKKKSPYVDFYYGNLANEKQVQKIISSIIKKKFKKINLINFAGGDIAGKDKYAAGSKPKNNNINISLEDFKIIYERNFITNFLVSRNFISNVIKKKIKAQIVNISSISATFPSFEEFAYSLSKNSILYLTKVLSKKFRNYGIKINCIAPCGTPSARFISNLKKRSKLDLKRIRSNKGLLGLASEDDISEAVFFLISNKSKLMSGQILKIDGGENSEPV